MGCMSVFYISETSSPHEPHKHTVLSKSRYISQPALCGALTGNKDPKKSQIHNKLELLLPVNKKFGLF